MSTPTKNNLILLLAATIAVVAGFMIFVAHTANVPVDKKDSADNGEVCIQVITPARNPDTGEVRDFPTPCDVPTGWEPIR